MPMSNFQFSGKLTDEDLEDLHKVSRSKTFWVKLFLKNLYGIGLVLVLLAVAIEGLMGQTEPNWRALGAIWLAVAGVVIWSVYRTKRARERQLIQFNGTLPDHISLNMNGVKWDGPNGATGFLPWSSFKGWREGQRVLLIDQREGNKAVILPVAQLSEGGRVPIRQFLASRVRPVSNHANANSPVLG